MKDSEGGDECHLGMDTANVRPCVGERKIVAPVVESMASESVE